MSETGVTVQDRDSVRTLTLDRAEKANALSAAMSEAIREGVLSAPVAGVRAIVLRGAGRHFCAGFDFGDFESLSDGDLALREAPTGALRGGE